MAASNEEHWDQFFEQHPNLTGCELEIKSKNGQRFCCPINKIEKHEGFVYFRSWYGSVYNDGWTDPLVVFYSDTKAPEDIGRSRVQFKLRDGEYATIFLPAKRIDLVRSGGPWVPALTIDENSTPGFVSINQTRDHILNLYRAGARGIVICGTTGRGHLLPLQAKIDLIEMVGQLHFRENFIRLAGLGTPFLREIEYIINTARQNRFHGVLALPMCHSEKKRDYYAGIAELCSQGQPDDQLSLLLYHHPQLNPNYTVTPNLLAKLMIDFPCVVGVKDSSLAGDPKGWIQACREACRRDPLVAIGQDKRILEGLENWAHAAIAGTANTAHGLEYLNKIFNFHYLKDETEAIWYQDQMNKQVDALLSEGDFIKTVTENRINHGTDN